MAKYQTLPNYEVIRPGIYVKFNLDGVFETTDADLIAYLDDKAPFIERVDKPEPKAEVKPAVKPVAKPKSK